MEKVIRTPNIICRYHTKDPEAPRYVIQGFRRDRNGIGSIGMDFAPAEVTIAYNHELTIEEPDIETLTTGFDYDRWCVRLAEHRWAPGIWAGTESAPVVYYDQMNQRHHTIVRQVDLVTRELMIDRPIPESQTVRLSDERGVSYGSAIYHQPVILGSEHGVVGQAEHPGGIEAIANNSGSLYGIRPLSRTNWGNVTSADVTLNLETLQNGLNQIASRGGRHG